MKPIGITQADPRHSGKHTSLVFAILVLRIQAMVFQLRNIDNRPLWIRQTRWPVAYRKRDSNTLLPSGPPL